MPQGVEIERKYLLDGMPDLPAGADVLQIEQGYLPDFGRIRRVVFKDGSIICTHTIKSGSGIARQENERTISIEEFEQLWPRTEGLRLRKTRYRARQDVAIWEIDKFDGQELTLAEIELNAIDAPVNIPTWLRAHIVREVTDDPNFTNSSIAKRINRAMDKADQ